MNSSLLRLTLAAATVAIGLSGASAARGEDTSFILKDAVRLEGLPLLIATNHLGLGAETQTLVDWVLKNRGPFRLDSASSSLKGSGASWTHLSPALARTLGRLNQWYGLEAVPEHPITHGQLKAAALSPASVERIRLIFETAIKRGVRVGTTWLTPETGGEATIDDELRLVEARDPRWSTIQDLAKVATDPHAIATLYEARAAEMAMVDTHGLLKVAVARFRLGSPGASEEVRRALLTVARNAAPTYSLGPEEQLTLITSADWRGRYVGAWHTHAPHDVDGAWGGTDVPSYEDMQNAVQLGQFLTLAFQPDGFDLYDAEPLADAKRVDLKLMKVIRYRSPQWREYFQKLHPGRKPKVADETPDPRD